MNDAAAVRLRGHHLLCLLGYRGLGYSEAFVGEMSRVHDRLRQEPATIVRLVRGPDDLCRACPAAEAHHCTTARVAERDARVMAAVDLRGQACWPWRDLAARLAQRVVPEDIARWCASCPWEPLGLCAQGLQRLRGAQGLRPVPNGPASTGGDR